MGKLYPEITEEIRAWISAQKIFFVSTAPLSGDGHVNCSPKGHDSFRVLDGKTVAYQDLTGSGAETIAHLKENGRIVIMFCAFEGPPKIFRFYGKGEVAERNSDKFRELEALFPSHIGTRAFIIVHIERITDSC